MNYGMRFVTLYRREGLKPSPCKGNVKKQNGCLGRPYKDTQAALDAVTGAAKGNYTMMDNLGVAMNATQI